MKLSRRSQRDLCQILANGGGLDLEMGDRSQTDLCELAKSADRGGARLQLRGASAKNQADLCQIATNGGGVVAFRD
jgi:hypothetical protein